MRSHAFCCRIALRDLPKRFLAFLSLRDVLMKFVMFCYIIFGWDILMRRNSFWPLWDVLVRLYSFCCTLSVRDISWRDVMIFWAVASFAYEISQCLFVCYAISWWDCMLFGCRIFFLMVLCKDGGEMDVGRLGCTRWFIGRCMVLCVQVGWGKWM